MKRNSSAGFSLLELMIVVVVLGIIAAIAYPSYTNYVERANRSEGQAYLLDVAAKQERYRSQNHSYVVDNVDIAKMGVQPISETGKYTLSVEKGEGGYVLTAAPTFNDSKCGDLMLNARGEKSVSRGTVKECWQ